MNIPEAGRTATQGHGWHGGRGPGGLAIGEHVKPVAGPSDEPDQVADQRRVAVQRVLDVQADPAVQLMAGAQCGRRLPGQPVRRDVDVRPGIHASSEPPACRDSSQVQRAAGDVDVRRLPGDCLERGERAAELLTGCDVGRGEVERPGERAVGHRHRTRQGQQVQVIECRLAPVGCLLVHAPIGPLPEHASDGGSVQADRVLRRAA